MTTEHGKSFAEASLARAEEALTAAQTLVEKGLLADAISRAYYAMYYAAQAILFSNHLSAKSHAGTISIFGKEIAEKGLVPKDFGKILHKAFNLRQKSDYEVDADFEPADVDKLIEQADNFISTIKKTLS